MPVGENSLVDCFSAGAGMATGYQLTAAVYAKPAAVFMSTLTGANLVRVVLAKPVSSKSGKKKYLYSGRHNIRRAEHTVFFYSTGSWSLFIEK